MELIPCEELILFWNCFLEASIPREGIEDFGIVVLLLCMGKEHPYCNQIQHISYMQTIWQLSTVDEKSIPALKINIFGGMAGSISSAGILEQSMGARNREGIGLS
jgi:hypothetical protein